MIDIYDILVASIVASVILVIIAVLLIFIGMFKEVLRGKKGEVKGGGVVLVGPIPIVFGTDRDVLKWAVILTVAALAAFTIITVTWLFLTHMRVSRGYL